MMPPLASQPSDSALARWYEMNMARPMIATGNIMMRPGSVLARYHATPPKSIPSVSRSLTESK